VRDHLALEELPDGLAEGLVVGVVDGALHGVIVCRGYRWVARLGL
jgi:hypothetical protein